MSDETPKPSLNERVAGLASNDIDKPYVPPDIWLTKGVELANDKDPVGQLGALIQLRQRGVTDRYQLAVLLNTSVGRVSQLEAQADLYLDELKVKYDGSPGAQRAMMLSQLETLQVEAAKIAFNTSLTASDRLRGIESARKIIEARAKISGVGVGSSDGTVINVDNRTQTNVQVEGNLQQMGLDATDVMALVKQVSMESMGAKIRAKHAPVSTKKLT